MKKISDVISDFLNDIKEIQSEYNYRYENVGLCDKATQDLLHELEFGDYDVARKTGPKIAKIRKARRYFKDYIEDAQPLIDFLNDNQNMQFIRRLQEVLGKVRKEENKKQIRDYSPRIIDGLDFIKKRKEIKDGKQ